MKKIFLSFILLMFLSANASDKLHVSALEDFSTTSPKEYFEVQLIEEGELDGVLLDKGDIVHCTIYKIADPTRGKRDSRIYFNIESWRSAYGVEHKPISRLVGKYAKTVISKDAIKSIPPKKAIKTTAGLVGNHFFKGVSYGISFVDGVIENPEDNRLKSGAKQVYKDSFLSYIEYGSEIELKKGDEFYLIVKPKKEAEDEILEDEQSVK